MTVITRKNGVNLVTEADVKATARTYNAIQTHSVSPIVPPATQTNHVPQFGQVIARTAEIQSVWTGTQAEYDLLTPVATTLYFIQ